MTINVFQEVQTSIGGMPRLPITTSTFTAQYSLVMVSAPSYHACHYDNINGSTGCPIPFRSDCRWWAFAVYKRDSMASGATTITDTYGVPLHSPVSGWPKLGVRVL